MAILTTAQKSILDGLIAAKRNYDESEEELELALRVRRNDNKQKVRDQVALAVEAGIPTRQIHLGMGMAQVTQLTNFLAPPKAPKTRTNILNLAQGLGQPVSLEPVVREQKMPAVHNAGNNTLKWMEDGVECYAIWRQYTPEYGYISDLAFGKLSELGQQTLKAERTFKCLFGTDERDAFLQDSIIPDRFNN